MPLSFKVFSPTGILIDEPILKLDFEAIDGFFTILPKHTDFITALKTGVVSYMKSNQKMAYLACEKGILIKKGDSVTLTTKLGILDDNLTQLTKTVEDNFKQMEESRKQANKAIAQLELNLVKGFLFSKKSEEAL